MMPGKGLDSIVVKPFLKKCSACSIWTCSFLKSTHEQHERMQNTFQKMQNLQLEIALMCVQYQIHIYRET